MTDEEINRMNKKAILQLMDDFTAHVEDYLSDPELAPIAWVLYTAIVATAHSVLAMDNLEKATEFDKVCVLFLLSVDSVKDAFSKELVHELKKFTVASRVNLFPLKGGFVGVPGEKDN